MQLFARCRSIKSEAVETIKQDADNCTRVKVSWLTAWKDTLPNLTILKGEMLGILKHSNRVPIVIRE